MISIDSGLLLMLAVLAAAVAIVWMVNVQEQGYNRAAADDMVRQAYIDGYEDGKAGVEYDPLYVAED